MMQLAKQMPGLMKYLLILKRLFLTVADGMQDARFLFQIITSISIIDKLLLFINC